VREDLDPETKTGSPEIEDVYSRTVVDHATKPRNVGMIANADGLARITGPCGDTMEIWLRVREGVIQRVSFWTDGCGPSIAAGSMATELVKGKQLEQALGISQEDILEALEGLPEDSVHCALLAANTLKAACRDYLSMRNEPWKRAYRK